MDLLDVNCEATRGVEFSGAMAALEVLSLLMLHQNYAWTLVNLGRLSFATQEYLSHLQSRARSTSTMAGEPGIVTHAL